MTTQHTPGPWKIVADETKGDHPYHQNRFIATNDFDEEEGTGSLICSMRDLEYQKQDAHLIASAPELLEACKLALHFIRNGKIDETIDVCVMLELSISKSEKI